MCMYVFLTMCAFLRSTAVNQLVAQHLLSKLKVICKTFDSRFVKHTHTQTQQIAPMLTLAKGQKKKKEKRNIKWLSLDWVILDLPLKQPGADALCQLMFRVMPVSAKPSLMRPRQVRCAQPSGAGNLSARALAPGKKKRKERKIYCRGTMQSIVLMVTDFIFPKAVSLSYRVSTLLGAEWDEWSI